MTALSNLGPIENRCRVSARVVGQAPRVMRLPGPLLDRMVERSISGDYRRLKELLESGAGAD